MERDFQLGSHADLRVDHFEAIDTTRRQTGNANGITDSPQVLLHSCTPRNKILHSQRPTTLLDVQAGTACNALVRWWRFPSLTFLTGHQPLIPRDR